ncbi:MAG: AAA family ATPase [Leadbetterella sp.]
MRKIIIIIGVSGSGKSTWAKAFCNQNPSYIRINRDAIRKSILNVPLNEYHTWDNSEKFKIETLVSQQFNAMIISCLKEGWDMVLDNTNLKVSYINEYKKILSENCDSYEISYKRMDLSLNECIVNDKNREDVVGEKVIMEQFQKLNSLKKLMSFEPEVYTKTVAYSNQQNKSLPPCILVDIDGTVAQMNGRYPFDWDKVGQDLPKENIIRTVILLKNTGNKVVFFSGRDEVCRAETTAWICKYFSWQVRDFELFMRKRNDQRKDSDVKLELFTNHIQDQYYVELVLDDRQQVVDMWRKKLGLTCLQVDYGNF